ncbi:MAG: sigma-70 family RNA polymerase sigma factor [Elusimicrobia bacterium]|nr:sigma-70 family RNA polymerase sigma factor [Elusimicrobiota bacterium]
MKEKELIKLAQNGDTKAFETLVMNYKNRLYRIAFSVCSRMPSETQDVAQETLISAFENIGSFKTNSAFGTWLYRIAANKCWQRFRKAKTENRSDMPDETKKGHPSRFCTEENAIKKELSRVVIGALEKLPVNYSMAIVLSDIEGLSDFEAAKKMGLSLGAFKTRLHRARNMLKKQLNDLR